MGRVGARPDDRVGRADHPHQLGSRPVFLPGGAGRLRRGAVRGDGDGPLRGGPIPHRPGSVADRHPRARGESRAANPGRLGGPPLVDRLLGPRGARGRCCDERAWRLGAGDPRGQRASLARGERGAAWRGLRGLPPRRQRAPLPRGERDALRRRERVARRGASERLARGASEARYAGASERLYPGASERRTRGASEARYAGASERLQPGASERVWPGAGESRPHYPAEPSPGG